MYYGTGLLSNYDKYPEHQSNSSEYVSKKKFIAHKKDKTRLHDEREEVLSDYRKVSLNLLIVMTYFTGVNGNVPVSRGQSTSTIHGC